MKKRIGMLLGSVFMLASLFLPCQAEESTGGVEYTVPFYFQWDPRWGAVPYGTGVIANTGCGPTCLAMVAQHLTNNVDYTPEYMADYAANLGYYVPGKGTAWALFTDACEDLNISGTSVSIDTSVWRSELDQEHLIILSMGQGDFTRNGHFIVLRGYNDEGFLVNDPNSPAKSQTTWDGDTLTSQAAGAWSFSCIQTAEIRYDLLPGLDEELVKALMEQQNQQ